MGEEAFVIFPDFHPFVIRLLDKTLSLITKRKAELNVLLLESMANKDVVLENKHRVELLKLTKANLSITQRYREEMTLYLKFVENKDVEGTQQFCDELYQRYVNCTSEQLIEEETNKAKVYN